MRQVRRGINGFTLIELLVVVFIIGLLASVVTISASSARAQSRDAKRKSDMQLVASSLELYYAANRKYPDSYEAWGWGALRTALVPNYSSAVPSDPLSSRPDGDFEQGGYAYRTDKAGGKFVLDATLERKDEKTTFTNTGAYNVTNQDDPVFFRSGTYSYGANEDIHYRVSSQ